MCVCSAGYAAQCRPVRLVLRVAFLGCVFLWLAIQSAHAQFTRFQNLADEQGLGNLVVDAVVQDSDGYILLGTEGGLYRYDGTTVAAYHPGLPSTGWIQQILTDKAGRVWVVMTDGLYVRQGLSFSRIDTGTTSLHLFSPHLVALSGGSIILDADGTLLRAPIDRNDIGKFVPLLDDTTLKKIPALADARFVVPDATGALLIGCGVALCRLDAGRVRVFASADGLPAEAWQVAFQTADGTIWARSLDHIAWRKRGQAVFAVATLPRQSAGSGARALGEHTSYVAHPERLDLASDRHGGVLTQSPGGLTSWNGTTWHAYPRHAGGLPAGRIQAFMLDREGSLWVGSFGMGAFRSIGLGHWEHWTADDGLPSAIVWSMTRLPNGQFWVATDSGTGALVGLPASIPPASIPPAFIPAETNYVAQATRGNRLWLAPVGTTLIRLDPATGALDRFASPGKVVSATVDQRNRLWLGASSGLLMVADADSPAADLRVRTVMSHDTNLVTTDPAGVVWALSRNGVFRRSVGGNFDLVISPAVLRSTPIALTFGQAGEVWVGTSSAGVLRFRVTGSHAAPLPPLLAPEIGSNNVLFAHRDRRGWIWLGTDHGIDMYDGRSWQHFDSSNGPITNDMNQSAVYEDFDGSMWFGTSHGLSHLIDPGRRAPSAVLHPRITSLSLGDRPLTLSKSIQFQWSLRPLVIRFVDLDYVHGRGIEFRYRLRGLDAGWSTTTEHEVRYAGLPAGRLRFELLAVDTVHGSASAPVGFTIHIGAPWWRRWWFLGLCALASAAMVIGAWQTRVRLLLGRQRHLEAVVSARTAEIEQARSELQRLAMSDALTGLANRRAIMDALKAAVAASSRARTPLAILLCDIDHFKHINDCFGHLAGDTVLADLGIRLGGAIDASEAAGRYGGEEFLLILPGEPAAIRRRVATIRSAITDLPYAFGDADRTVTSSAGLAFLRAGDTALSLVARADDALYKAKELGRNRIEEERSAFAEPVHAVAPRTRSA